MPLIQDPDQETFTIQVNLGDSLAFATYSKLTFTFDPKEIDVRVKEYVIRIKLTDNNSSPKSSSYSLIVRVNSNITQSNINNQ